MVVMATEASGMTPREWVGMLAALTVIATFLGAAIRWWIKGMIVEQKEITKKIATRNGHTIGEVSEGTYEKMEEVLTNSRNNTVLIDALTRRFDEHITFGGHHTHDGDN
jgi:hypothetical protein